ncbi:MAG TPA: hypothetical protein VJP05_02860, partial [Acidimicrobiia bacterium]|nr:hypothetical protein [Acidimicrobiia bacterium]
MRASAASKLPAWRALSKGAGRDAAYPRVETRRGARGDREDATVAKRYEAVPHTADVAFIAYGDTL